MNLLQGLRIYANRDGTWCLFDNGVQLYKGTHEGCIKALGRVLEYVHLKRMAEKAFL